MKFILIISLSFSLIAFGQADSLGFINKAEAKNLMVNGLKEGKWVEYLDFKGRTTSDTNAPDYMLTIYKKGVPIGIVRWYTKLQTLEQKVYYNDGIIDSSKLFDEQGNEIK